MTPSRSFFYFRAFLSSLLLCAAIIASGCSRNSLNEKADGFRAQGSDAVRQFRYVDAEQLFNEALPLYAQADNPDRFNETTAALADVEQKRGKLSRAFMHYHAALAYFEQKREPRQITSFSISLAELYAQTGRTDSAALFALNALKAASDASDNAGRAASEYELGRIELMNGRAASASEHFAAAAGFGSSPLSADIALRHAYALALLGRRDDAIQQLSLASGAAASMRESEEVTKIHAGTGAVYLLLGLTDDAEQAFEAGLKSVDAAHVPGMRAQLLCGLGETYFAREAYQQAEAMFSKAYAAASSENTPAAMGFCLLRMGECHEHMMLHAPSGAAVLRTFTLYRTAGKLFVKDPSPWRTALAQVKSAVLRAALHEDADAEPLFQSAFDLMRRSEAPIVHSADPFLITDEARLLPSGSSRDDWWYRPFASFLIHKRRIGEALAVLDEGEESALRREVRGYPIALSDSVRSAAVSAYLARVRSLCVAETELMERQSLSSRVIDASDTDSLRSNFRTLAITVIQEGDALLSRSAALRPLASPAARTTPASIEGRLPEDGCIVSYAPLGKRFYVIVLPHGGTATAVDLGPDAPMLSRLAAWKAELRHNASLAAQGLKTDDAGLRQLSGGITAALVQPIRRYLSRRVILHATRTIEALPLHAFMMNQGRAGSDMPVVTYRPILSRVGQDASNDAPLKSVTAFGAPSAGSLEAEAELRSIKNFYVEASVIASQLATEKNFREASGDIMHISTLSGRDAVIGTSTIAFSGGTITSSDAFRPVSTFLSARPHRLYLIADLQRDTSLLSPVAAVFALMSGTSGCILQQSPVSAAAAKAFNEFFYTALPQYGSGMTCYTEAIGQLQRRMGNNEALGAPSYYYFE
ncbi:MAG: tetratricopeptide repeat protein [Acidobacteriota bacterium]